MDFVAKVEQRDLSQVTDEMLLEARKRLKGTYDFYYKITQEEGIDLTKPRGKSAKENCEKIHAVGLKLKAEIDKRKIKLN